MTRHHGGPGWFQSHATGKVDEALDAAKATPAQRNAIHASLEHVFDSFAQGQKAGGEAILINFSSDGLDYLYVVIRPSICIAASAER